MLDGRSLRLNSVSAAVQVCVFPDYFRSPNKREFTASADRDWLAGNVMMTLHIEPGRPWENGYVESLIGKFWDELIERKIFYTLPEAEVLIQRWRDHYTRVWPHSPLGYRRPAPDAIAFEALAAGCATLRRASLRTPPILDSECVGPT